MGVLISRELSLLKLVKLGILNRTIGVEMVCGIVLSENSSYFVTRL